MSYPLAGVGNRLLAAFLDVLILTVLLTGLGLAGAVFAPRLGLDPTLSSILAGIFLVLLVLVLPFAYSVLLEAFWNGQTLGKRIVGIRVLRDDGAPVGFFTVVARDLIRVIDLLPPVLALDVLLILVTPKGQRLGDLVAGTVVVKATLERDFQSLRTHATGAPASLSVRGLSGEAQRLVREFARREASLSPEARAAVARSIAQGLRPAIPESADHPDDVEFLRAVAASLRERA